MIGSKIEGYNSTIKTLTFQNVQQVQKNHKKEHSPLICLGQVTSLSNYFALNTLAYQNKVLFLKKKLYLNIIIYFFCFPFTLIAFYTVLYNSFVSPQYKKYINT